MNRLMLANENGLTAAKTRRLIQMKRVATGLLLGMAGLLALARWGKPRYPWLGWVEAMAEAAVVGGLADWFAVVALFRHPLGLPIPHTAIVPQNKDRIGAALGQFVAHNFLTPANLAAKLGEFDIPGQAADWLADPAHSAAAARDIAPYLPRLLAGIDDQAVADAIERAVLERIEALSFSGLAAGILANFTAENRHQTVLMNLLQAARRWLDQNRELIRARIKSQMPMLPQMLEAMVANQLVDGILALIDEIDRDPEHGVRRALDQRLAEIEAGLREDPAYGAYADWLKDQLVQRLRGTPVFAGLWIALKQGLTGPAGITAIEAQLGPGLNRLAAEIAGDPALKAALNQRLAAGVEAGLGRFHIEIAGLIADIVGRWDSEDVALKIETEVGRDLQFIRLNGTVVGGLAGLALYALFWVFGDFMAL